MRIVFLGHACHLVETGRVRVLTDPWLTDPIFEGTVVRDPALAFSIEDLPPLDAIALTHGHLDHLNAPTLAALADKSLPVLIPRSSLTELERALRLLGFGDVRQLDDWEEARIGDLRVAATPSLGVLDECAFALLSDDGRSFFDGGDAPQPPEVMEAIAARYGRFDAGGFSHNSFDGPSLLGLPSFKNADHGPAGAVASARTLGVRAAVAAASNMRWTGAAGAAITAKVIRRSHEDFFAVLARELPAVAVLDLEPGDAWSLEGGIERGAVRGRPAPAAAHDYVHALLGTGARWCPPGRPSTEDTFRRDLPARLAAAPEVAAHVGTSVLFEIGGQDPGTYTVDFRRPGAPPEAGDTGAAFALRMDCEMWKDLFERRMPWQCAMVNDRLEVTRLREGAPPDGLHFVYAMQAVFP